MSVWSFGPLASRILAEGDRSPWVWNLQLQVRNTQTVQSRRNNAIETLTRTPVKAGTTSGYDSELREKRARFEKPRGSYSSASAEFGSNTMYGLFFGTELHNSTLTGPFGKESGALEHRDVRPCMSPNPADANDAHCLAAYAMTRSNTWRFQ